MLGCRLAVGFALGRRRLPDEKGIETDRPCIVRRPQSVWRRRLPDEKGIETPQCLAGDTSSRTGGAASPMRRGLKQIELRPKRSCLVGEGGAASPMRRGLKLDVLDGHTGIEMQGGAARS